MSHTYQKDKLYSDSNKRSKCNERCSKRSVEFGIYHTEPVASTTTMNVPAYLFKEAFSHLTSSCIFHTDKKNRFLCLVFDFVPKDFSYFLILYCFYHNATDSPLTINFVIAFFLSVYFFFQYFRILKSCFSNTFKIVFFG